MFFWKTLEDVPEDVRPSRTFSGGRQFFQNIEISFKLTNINVFQRPRERGVHLLDHLPTSSKKNNTKLPPPGCQVTLIWGRACVYKRTPRSVPFASQCAQCSTKAGQDGCIAVVVVPCVVGPGVHMAPQAVIPGSFSVIIKIPALAHGLQPPFLLRLRLQFCQMVQAAGAERHIAK